MEKVFVDTNIIIDWLGKREPFFKYAKGVFQLADDNKITLLLSSMSFVTVEYILRKEIGKDKVKKALLGIRTFSRVCNTGEKEIDLALLSDMKDFEDALQYFTAKNNLANVIITRNPKDFLKSTLPVMSAEEYLKYRAGRAT